MNKICVCVQCMFFLCRSAPPEIEENTWRKLLKVYKNNPRHIDPFTGFRQLIIATAPNWESQTLSKCTRQNTDSNRSKRLHFDFFGCGSARLQHHPQRCFKVGLLRLFLRMVVLDLSSRASSRNRLFSII